MSYDNCYRILYTDNNGNDHYYKSYFKTENRAAKQVKKLISNPNIKIVTLFELSDKNSLYYHTIFNYVKYTNKPHHFRYNGYNFELFSDCMDEINRHALNEIYRNINSGYNYVEYMGNVKYPYFPFKLGISENNKYIRWNNYGSSANKNTMRDLNWIVNIIFDCTPYEFINKYWIEKDL